MRWASVILLPFIFLLLIALISNAESGETADDEAMSEILRLQEQEAEEMKLVEEEEVLRSQEASDIERNGASKTASSEEGTNAKKRDSSSTGRGEFIKGRGGSLKAANTGGLELDEKKSRGERISSSIKQGAASNAFFSQKATNVGGVGRERQDRGNRGRVTMGAGGVADEIEKMLSPDLLHRHTEAASKREEDETELKEKIERFRVSYKYVRPISKVLLAYRKTPPDYYKILDVPHHAPPEEVKLAYRRVAMDIHPDKNRHPDAKIAFDCLQEAYDVLSSESQRKVYDTSLSKRKRKVWIARSKAIINFLHNMKSKMQLLIARGKDYDLGSDINELKEAFEIVVNGIKDVYNKLIWAPTFEDKLMLLKDLVADNKSRWIAGICALAILS